ncbi:MAG: tRNA (N(6)-L-threonylcarbamoyladenosine(37)-C(2))-methylthiotransferase MtaB [Alphaproteobacteria bacterium]
MTLPSTNSVVTFGCRLNTYESQVIKDLVTQAEVTNTIVINTCAVTTEAERQARQAIRKLKRQNPGAEIIVTGCAAQINPKQFQDMPEVHRILGNEAKMVVESYLSSEKTIINDIMEVTETAAHLVAGFDGRVRAYVQIQNGCNHRCTFCTIPYGRGNSRSVPLGAIINQVRSLLDNGYQEIVLTGVDITDYGQDLPGKPALGQMIRRLLRLLPELKRLRLTSVDSVEIDDDLWELIATEERLMPHLHLSLQAGDDMILKRMKRRHLRDDAIRFCERARRSRPDVVFGADLIAGFPTETDEMAANSLKIIDECDLSYLHVFPYSARPNTPASRMPQVPHALIKSRAETLRQAGHYAFQRLLQRLQGQTVNVLVESTDAGIIKGKTDHFTPIIIESTAAVAIGDIVKASITGMTQNELLGIRIA